MKSSHPRYYTKCTHAEILITFIFMGLSIQVLNVYQKNSILKLIKINNVKG